MKIIYSQFVVNPSALEPAHLATLKEYLYAPRQGEALVQWGNSLYGRSLTVSSAIERADLLLAGRRGKCSPHLLWVLLLAVLGVRLLA